MLRPFALIFGGQPVIRMVTTIDRILVINSPVAGVLLIGLRMHRVGMRMQKCMPQRRQVLPPQID